MNNDQLKNRLLNVISTLDAINLSGIENQRRLVACADYLKETIKMVEAQLVPLSDDAANAFKTVATSAEITAKTVDSAASSASSAAEGG